MHWLVIVLADYFNKFIRWLSDKFSSKKNIPAVTKELPQEKEESFKLTLRGEIVCSVMFQGPLSLEDLVRLHPHENFAEIVATVDELLNTGAITIENGLLKEGNALHDPT